MRFVLSVLALIALGGCRFSTESQRLGPVLAPTQAEHVTVLYTVPTRSYDVVGRVVAAADLMSVDNAAWEKHFRNEAAKLGGDAVVFGASLINQTGETTYRLGQSVAVAPSATATRVGYVIKWKPTP